MLICSSIGRRPVGLCHGLVPVVRPSMHALTFILNIYFSETAYPILIIFLRNVPAMVLFRISSKSLIPLKTLVAIATELNIRNL